MISRFLKSLVEKPENLRKVIIIKLLIACVMFAVLSDVIYLGDKSTIAADNKAESASTSQKVESAKPKTDQAPSKSIIDRLLNLPDISTVESKKDELGKYLALAERKKQQVEDRLKALEKQSAVLTALEKSIDGKLLQLDEERKFIAQTIQREKDLKGKRLDKLIELYAKMDARKAAPVFEQLDKDLVVELFKNLSQKQVTKILEAMNTAKSVELTEYYGRVRSGREYDMLREMNKSLRKEFDACKGLADKSFDEEDSPPRVASANNTLDNSEPIEQASAPATAPASADTIAPSANLSPAAAPVSENPQTTPAATQSEQSPQPTPTQA
jgi:flagellar motility protein MotE (MotC chaperone)